MPVYGEWVQPADVYAGTYASDLTAGARREGAGPISTDDPTYGLRPDGSAGGGGDGAYANQLYNYGPGRKISNFNEPYQNDGAGDESGFLGTQFSLHRYSWSFMYYKSETDYNGNPPGWYSSGGSPRESVWSHYSNAIFFNMHALAARSDVVKAPTSAQLAAAGAIGYELESPRASRAVQWQWVIGKYMMWSTNGMSVVGGSPPSSHLTAEMRRLPYNEYSVINSKPIIPATPWRDPWNTPMPEGNGSYDPPTPWREVPKWVEEFPSFDPDIGDADDAGGGSLMFTTVPTEFKPRSEDPSYPGSGIPYWIKDEKLVQNLQFQFYDWYQGADGFIGYTFHHSADFEALKAAWPVDYDTQATLYNGCSSYFRLQTGTSYGDRMAVYTWWTPPRHRYIYPDPPQVYTDLEAHGDASSGASVRLTGRPVTPAMAMMVGDMRGEPVATTAVYETGQPLTTLRYDDEGTPLDRPPSPPRHLEE